MSADGQALVEENGYISMETTESYVPAGVSGRVIVGGSSSVTPVMEKLAEAYLTLNPQAQVEVQQTDSTTGVQNVIDGICDVGMASRELKESELATGVTATTIAMDGIAVIVHPESTVEELTGEQVMQIYTTDGACWEDILN